MKKIVFTGGGTGGHIMPNLSLIEVLQNSYQIYYLGTDGMEKRLLEPYKKVKFIEIPAVKFVRSLTLKNLAIPFKLFSSIKACKKILANISPSVIFSKGGFVSIPVCLAGQKLGIPTITHESDLTMGLANKIIGRHASVVCCSFEKTAKKHEKNAIFTGSPIRPQIYSGNPQNVTKKHNIETGKPIILVTGGSLGASALNSIIWENISALTAKYTILHLVGKGKTNKTIPNSRSYIQLEFAKNIEDYFAISDLVISRAGSNTIFELLALKKTMVLIPLPKKSSRGDQILNAIEFNNNGFCEYILQENLSIETLLKKISDTLNNKDKFISQMSSTSSADGTDTLVKLIKKYADM